MIDLRQSGDNKRKLFNRILAKVLFKDQVGDNASDANEKEIKNKREIQIKMKLMMQVKIYPR